MNAFLFSFFFPDQFTKNPDLKQNKVRELRFGVTEEAMQREGRGI